MTIYAGLSKLQKRNSFTYKRQLHPGGGCHFRNKLFFFPESKWRRSGNQAQQRVIVPRGSLTFPRLPGFWHSVAQESNVRLGNKKGGEQKKTDKHFCNICKMYCKEKRCTERRHHTDECHSFDYLHLYYHFTSLAHQLRLYTVLYACTRTLHVERYDWVHE